MWQAEQKVGQKCKHGHARKTGSGSLAEVEFWSLNAFKISCEF